MKDFLTIPTIFLGFVLITIVIGWILEAIEYFRNKAQNKS